MRVLTWNVNGIRARADEFTALAAETKADVICLQEIKSTPDQLPASLLPLTFPDYFSFWHGAAGGYSGVSLHLRRASFSKAPAFSHPSFDHETRVVQGRVGDRVFASMYVPNGGKDYDAKIAFMKQLAGWVDSIHASGATLVLAGDMNVALEDRDVHPTQRKANAIGQRGEERALLRAMIERGLVDVGRALAPNDDRLYTWWPYWRELRQKNEGWRLDYVFASRDFARKARECVVRRDFGTSDHGPLLVTFEE